MRIAVSLFAFFAVGFLSSAQAQEARQFLSAPFLCSDGSPLPTLAKTNERYLHEFKDFTQTQHRACATVVDAPMLPGDRPQARQKCEEFDLVSYTVMCSGGAVSAARWWAASDAARRGQYEIDGETLLVSLKGSSGWGGSPSSGITGLRIGQGSTTYARLPSGYGFSLNLPVQTLSLKWESLEIPVSGTVTQSVNRPPPAAPWVQLLADWYPWPQLLLGIPLLAYGLISLAGVRSHETAPGKGTRLVLALTAALIALAFSPVPARMPEGAYKAAQNDLARARTELAAIDRDRAELTKIVRVSRTTGMVEPIAVSAVRRIAELTRPRSIASPRMPDVQPAFWATLALLPALAFPALFILPFLRGWHYLFVRHPAAIVAEPALKTGALLDKQQMGAALRPNPAELHDHPPAYKSWNLFERARALKEKINADADIAEAAMRRDRARAQKMQAEAELRAARKKLPWWQRWIAP